MKKYIVSQFGNPRGPIGRLAGKIMARRNVERNVWVVSQLSIEPNHRVLEIGFGPGLAIREASKRIVTGKITGIDHSNVMLSQATHRNLPAIRSGKVQLICCPVDDMNFERASFDRVFAINAFMFWSNPVEQIRRIGTLLKPDGRLAIAIQPRWTTDLEAVENKIAARFHEAGFTKIERIQKDLEPVGCICVMGDMIKK